MRVGGLCAFALILACAWAPTGYAARLSADSAPDRLKWPTQYDFDGDGKTDMMLSTFTGGAHCCYTIGVKLTSLNKTILLPFEMDAGYIGGLTLENADHFTIRTRIGQLPEILMEINTYGPNFYPIPRAWEKRYGITSHYIGVSFPNGQVLARDVHNWPSHSRLTP